MDAIDVVSKFIYPEKHLLRQESLLNNPEPVYIGSFPSWMEQPDVILKSPVDVNLVARRARVSHRLHVFLFQMTLHLRLILCTVIAQEANCPHGTWHGLGGHQGLHVLRRIYKRDNGNCSSWIYYLDLAITHSQN